ncbi:MAG: Hsp20/alpha crystallin family protein, partial [Nanoarchaeota archaeon]
MNPVLKANNYDIGTPLARLWNYSDFLCDWRDYEDFFHILSKNVRESKDENSYTLEFDVPGFTKEEINVEIENSYVTVTSKSETNKNRKNLSYSIYIDSFFYDLDNTTTKLQNGVLTVTFPKSANTKKRK